MISDDVVKTTSRNSDSAQLQGPPSDTDDAMRLRAERDLYWSKLEQTAEAIGSDNPLRIVHDVRNVLNELVLLRKLVDLDSE